MTEVNVHVMYTPRRTASQAVPTVAQILSRPDGVSAV